MRVLGLSFQFHDAAASVVEDDKILYASHSERYSKIKNDPWLNQEMITACLEFGKPDVIALHEKPFIKQLRNIYAGNWSALREPTKTFILTSKIYPLKHIGIMRHMPPQEF
jgi:predicted NodU family carbamoyl transferase